MHHKRLRSYAAGMLAAVLLALSFFAAFSTINPGKAYAAANYPVTGWYTVRSGDSLYSIANRFGTTISGLKAANKLGSDMIMSGQILVISLNSPSGSGYYTVRAGDALYMIAGKYGITISELKWDNALKSDMIFPGQLLTIPQRTAKPLKDILSAKGITGGLYITVDKSDHVLGIFSSQGTLLKSYHVELGDNGLGDKQVAGDHKTPEGNLYITQKLVLNPADYYLGTRWMRLSYPNIEDADRGLRQGIIDQKTHDSIVEAINNGQTPPQDTALGGGVGIHGGSTPEFGKDWTFGCTGLTNADVQDFYDYVNVGTKVFIQQ